MKKTTLLLTVCLALLVAGNAFCSSTVSFWVERTDDGTTGVWTYTLYNDSTDGFITLDGFGLFGSSASSLEAVDPAPVGWDLCDEDDLIYYNDYMQVVWVAGMENIPEAGQSVAGFSIYAPEGATAPTKFEVVYIPSDVWDYVDFTGDIYDPNALPEPSSAMALMAALPMMGAAAYRRKRKTSNN